MENNKIKTENTVSAPVKFTMTVDAAKDVLDIDAGGLKRVLVPHEVVTGAQYTVSVNSSVKYQGSLLNVSKVVIYNTTIDQSNGWFYVIEEDKPIVITIGELGYKSTFVYAFLIDIASQDNTGSAVVTFTPL